MPTLIRSAFLHSPILRTIRSTGWIHRWSGVGLFVKRGDGHAPAGILLAKPIPYTGTQVHRFEPAPAARVNLTVNTLHDHARAGIADTATVRRFPELRAPTNFRRAGRDQTA